MRSRRFDQYRVMLTPDTNNAASTCGREPAGGRHNSSFDDLVNQPVSIVMDWCAIYYAPVLR